MSKNVKPLTICVTGRRGGGGEHGSDARERLDFHNEYDLMQKIIRATIRLACSLLYFRPTIEVVPGAADRAPMTYGGS